MSYCAYGSGFVKFLPITEEEAATQVTRLLRHVRKDFSIDGITDKQSASLKLEAMLCGILKKIAYGVDIDDQTGSIADSLCVDLSFNGNYNKDSWASSLDLLSPIVEAGEICFIGEDDSHFRLIFRDGTWAGDNGHVCWDGSFNIQNCIFAHSHSDEVPDCYTPEENNPFNQGDKLMNQKIKLALQKSDSSGGHSYFFKNYLLPFLVLAFIFICLSIGISIRLNAGNENYSDDISVIVRDDGTMYLQRGDAITILRDKNGNPLIYNENEDDIE